jgi:hypothetical protein
MGSSQSAPVVATQQPPTALAEKSVKAQNNDAQGQRPPTKRKHKKPLTGFAAVQHKCRRKKKEYDTCYGELYGGFVSAKETDTSGCEELFDDWRECVLRGMKKDRDRRGVKTPLNPESMLAELEGDDA